MRPFPAVARNRPSLEIAMAMIAAGEPPTEEVVPSNSS
jgi:hypothetical protein